MSLAETLPASDLSSSQEKPLVGTSSSSAAKHMDHHSSESTSLSTSSSANTTTTTTASTISSTPEHVPGTTTPTATISYAHSSPSKGFSVSSIKSKSSSVISPKPLSTYYSSSGTRTASSRASSPPASSSSVSSPSLSAATTSLLMLSSSERHSDQDDRTIKMEEVTYSMPPHHQHQQHYPQHPQHNHYPQPSQRGDDDYDGDLGESQRKDRHAQAHAPFPHRAQESSSSDVHNGYEDAEMKDGSTEPTSISTTTTITTSITSAAGITNPEPRAKASSGTPKASQAKKRLASPSSPSPSTNMDGYASSTALPGGMSMTPSPSLRPQSAEIGSPQSRKNSVSSARKEQKVGVTATSCANCGTTTTPLWRRASNGQTICNACGLYFKARNLTRPPWLKRTPGGKKVDSTGDEGDDMDDSTTTTTTLGPEGSSNHHKSNATTTSSTGGTGDANGEDKTNDSECAGSCPGDGNCNGTGGAYSCAGCPSFNQHQANRQSLVCANCRTTTTPLWRRDTGGNTICNACGLYFKLHNVHRPVTMKRAVIKRRKRVNLLASSPPPAEGEEATGTQPAPLKQPKPRQPKSKKAAAAAAAATSANASTSDSAMPTASDLEPSEDQGDKVETPAKRRKLQNTQTSPKPVPNIEDFIMPKRAANGQTEWMPKDSHHHHHHHHHRRSISPIENIGSAHGEKDIHPENSHEEGHVERDHDHDRGHHTPQSHESSYSQQSSSRTDAHAHMRELPPLPLPQEPRYGHSIFHGQYHSSPSMAMSRYPPMHHPSPPRISHSSSQSYSSSSHSHSQSSPHHSSDSRYSPPTHYSRPISMQGYQAPPHHRHDMDDMPTYSPYSSGWNQRLPGYATVSSSANTRLSSTGVVRSGSPPLYPRPVSPSHPYPHSHYRSSGSAHAPLQPGHGYQRQKLPPPTSSSSSSSYGSSFHHILNPANSEVANDRESAQLPPISMPGSSSNNSNNSNRMSHHQPLPRASEIIQHESSRHSQHSPHRYDQHQRRPASPSGSPMSGVASGALSAAAAAASTVAGIPVTNTDMLQKTREDLQREVSHLSMLLGRAAAVLNGLDQVLGPNGGSGNAASNVDLPPSSQAHQGQPGSQSPTHHSSLSSDMKTNSALASLMALSASGGPDTGFKSNSNHDDLSSHGPPPPPQSSYRQALPYPLPRRRDRDE